MPAETHQLGREVDHRSVLDLLVTMLGEDSEANAHATFESLGIQNEDLPAVWRAVCEEYAERALAPDLDPGILESSMTLESAAHIMVRLLSGKAPDGG